MEAFIISDAKTVRKGLFKKQYVLDFSYIRIKRGDDHFSYRVKDGILADKKVSVKELKSLLYTFRKDNIICDVPETKLLLQQLDIDTASVLTELYFLHRNAPVPHKIILHSNPEIEIGFIRENFDGTRTGVITSDNPYFNKGDILDFPSSESYAFGANEKTTKEKHLAFQEKRNDLIFLGKELNERTYEPSMVEDRYNQLKGYIKL